MRGPGSEPGWGILGIERAKAVVAQYAVRLPRLPIVGAIVKNQGAVPGQQQRYATQEHVEHFALSRSVVRDDEVGASVSSGEQACRVGAKRC